MNPCPTSLHGRRVQITLCAALLLLFTGPARAIVFQYGDVKGSFDTTLSIGALSRLDNPDPALYGLTNSYAGIPGRQYSVNADDGDLNYHKGLASLLVKASHDFEIDYHDVGAFVRGYYFNDFINSGGTRPHIPLSDQADSLVSQGGELLDAYAYFKPTLGDMPASFRVGRQVLSWGESTFIPNGINSINPIDVAKLRAPGSELKEALLPVDMVSGSISLNADFTLEAFYLLEWKKTRIDPPGTLFSTNDFVAPGGRKVYLGFGQIADTAVLGPVYRGADRQPQNSGQWGVNLKWLAHGLGETEFGLYFMNYHSRLPFVSAMTPTGPVSAAVVQSTASSLGQANLLPALIPYFGAGSGTALSTLLGAALTGVPVGALPANLQPFYPAAQQIATGAKTVGFLTAAATGQYLVEYPSDIHLLGASFNTSVGGVAIQGEVSYRDNQPLQVDDVELLFAAMSPLNPAYGPNNQIGNYAGQYSTYIQGYRRHSVWTGQVTATKVARGILGAQQSTLIAEVGFVQADLPSKSTLRFDGPGTYRAGDINEMVNTGNGAVGADPESAFADSFSWGYQLVGKLDYNNVFAGVNVSPLAVFAQDVSGNTPLPLGNFRGGRKTITLGADFNFQQQWALELRYVNFLGAGQYNLLSDRDYVSATIKYSF